MNECKWKDSKNVCYYDDMDRVENAVEIITFCDNTVTVLRTELIYYEFCPFCGKKIIRCY